MIAPPMPISAYPSTEPITASRPGKWAVLKVVLQNPCGQRGVWRVLLRLNRAYNLSTADHFGRRESGNLRREDQVDFQLRAGLEQFVRLEEHSRPADVFGCPYVPLFLAKAAITQRQVKVESLRSRRWNFPRSRGLLGFCGLRGHSDLRGSWGCIEHFADLAFQVAKVKGLLEQAYP